MENLNQNNNNNGSLNPEKARIQRRRPADKNSDVTVPNAVFFIAFFIFSFLWYDSVLHISHFKELNGSFFAYAVLFDTAAALLFAFLCSLGPRKVNYWVTFGFFTALSVYFGVQVVYSYFFKDFFYLELLEVGGNIWQFWRETLTAIWKNLVPILLFFIPPVFFLFAGKKIIKPVPFALTSRIICVILIVLFHLGGTAYVNSHKDATGDRYLYNEGFLMSDAVAKFGMFTATRLDVKYTVFGHSENNNVEELTTGAETTLDWGNLFGTTAAEKPVTEAPETSDNTAAPGDSTAASDSDTPATTIEITTAEVTTEPEITVDTSPNVMDIDFDSLIANASNTAEKNAHTWFSTRTATNKNEYTGLFEGKNLIWITVESWAPAAINETLTPTLWKMKNEGFVFENYFCSNWGGSTATGEYADITGNFYNSASCLKNSASTLQKFTAGNVLGKLGYTCLGFHNWTATYYGRDLSHTNFGYDWHGTTYVSSGNYPGTNGWNVSFTRAWPTSDAELADYTVSYIPTDGKPFHIYYMTVSGHPYQTWSNSQARKHKAEILAAKLDYTDDNALSYIACQYEVELMVSTLVKDLTEKGLLEDTVFVMSPDHYPYDITGDDTKNVVTLSQLYNISSDDIFTNYNLYRAPLIIWSASMTEPVKVTKVCSAIDILPTVLNLFGAEYDSRLIMGRDILSDSEGFVILNMSNGAGNVAASYNWLCDYGFYRNSTKTFTPFEGVTVDADALKASGYISYHSTLLNNMYTYSKYILDKDYYRKVFPNG